MSMESYLVFLYGTSLLFKMELPYFVGKYRKGNNAILKVKRWFYVNNRFLNDNKTKYIKFSTPIENHIDINVQVNEKTVDLVDLQ